MQSNKLRLQFEILVLWDIWVGLASTDEFTLFIKKRSGVASLKHCIHVLTISFSSESQLKKKTIIFLIEIPRTLNLRFSRT